MEQELQRAVMAALRAIGVKRFKQTSLFMSSKRVRLPEKIAA